MKPKTQIELRDAKMQAMKDLLKLLQSLNIDSAKPWWIRSNPAAHIQMLLELLQAQLIDLGKARILLNLVD